MARFKIIANAPVTCHGYGLDFVSGVAYTDDEEIAEYLRGKSYTVEEQLQKATQKNQKK